MKPGRAKLWTGIPNYQDPLWTDIGPESNADVVAVGTVSAYCYCLLLLPVGIAGCHCLLLLPVAIDARIPNYQIPLWTDIGPESNEIVFQERESRIKVLQILC